MIGLRELAIVAAVVVALYGRSNVLRSQRFQSILPWISPTRRPSAGSRRSTMGGSAAASRGWSGGGTEVFTETGTEAVPNRTGKWASLLGGNRLYWTLTILAATAIAAWVVTRTLIVTGAGAGSGYSP
jgi:hypothetical protein